MEEGGGSTSTYPFEKWHYRYLEGLETTSILSLWILACAATYHMTIDRSEKDALLHTPGMGLYTMGSHGKGREDGPLQWRRPGESGTRPGNPGEPK